MKIVIKVNTTRKIVDITNSVLEIGNACIEQMFTRRKRLENDDNE